MLWIFNATFLMLVIGATCNASVDPYALPQYRLRLPSNARKIQPFQVNPIAVDVTSHSENAPLPFALPERTVGGPYSVDIAEEQLPTRLAHNELVQIGDNNFVSAAASIDGSDNRLSVNILLPSPEVSAVVGGVELRDSYGVPAEEFKGHEEYGVPHEEYGPPPVVSEPNVVLSVNEEYGVPQEEYGPPPVVSEPNVVLSVNKEYGVPHEEYGVPHEEYGPPPVTFHPHEEYGVPTSEDHSEVVPTTETTTKTTTEPTVETTTTATRTPTTSKSYEQKPPEVIHTYSTYYYPVHPKLSVQPITTNSPHTGNLFGKLLKLKKRFYAGLLNFGKVL